MSTHSSETGTNLDPQMLAAIGDAPHSWLTNLPEDARERIKDEAAHPTLLEADNGQVFSALLMNAHRLGQARPVVAPSSFLRSAYELNGRWEAAQGAARFQDRPFLLLDMHNHGKSSQYTFRQAAAMVTTGNITPSAKPQLSAVNNLLGAETKRDYAGYSYGGRMALAMAVLPGNTTTANIVAAEVPGLTNRFTPALQWDYVMRERTRKEKVYKPVLEALGLTAELEAFDACMPEQEVVLNFFQRSRVWSFINLLRSPNARRTTPYDLWAALEQEDVRIHLISGERSKVSPAQAAEDARDSIPGSRQDRLTLQTRPYEDHNMACLELLPRLFDDAAKQFARMDAAREQESKAPF